MSKFLKDARLTLRVLRLSAVLTQFATLRTFDSVEPDLYSARQVHCVVPEIFPLFEIQHTRHHLLKKAFFSGQVE